MEREMNPWEKTEQCTPEQRQWAHSKLDEIFDTSDPKLVWWIRFSLNLCTKNAMK
jgi:hypothetical protein